MTGSPVLSVVVVVHDMVREAPRTLHSLSAAYQEGIAGADYEVIVIENGSARALPENSVRACGPNFRYHYVQEASPSPAPAMNLGISMARGRHVGLLIDGARIATPGLLSMALLGLRMSERAIVSTLGWHLGPTTQVRSVREGYDTAAEDALLESIHWPANGYDLFTIAAFAGSSEEGFFRPIAESNALFMPRELVDELRGLDERFTLPGGGAVNLDLYERCCALPDSTLVVLLGEGTFHQIHGGVATNAPKESGYVGRALVQYQELRGRRYEKPQRSAIYLGTIPDQAVPFLAASLDRGKATAE